MFSHFDNRVDIVSAARAQFAKRGVASQTVLQIAQLESFATVTDHITQVIRIGSVGEHIRNLKLVATFGVRVSGHNHANFSTAQIVGSCAAIKDALDFASRVTQRNELLQKLGIAVLNIVQINHNVVAHFQR